MKGENKSIYDFILKAPLFWAFVCLLTGILSFSFFKPTKLILIFSLSAGIFALLIFLKSKKKNLFYPMLVLIFSLGISAVGVLLMQAHSFSPPELNLTDKKPFRLKLEIKIPSENKKGFSRVLAKTIWIDDGKELSFKKTYLWLNYYSEEKFFPKDKIIVWSYLRPIKGFKNFGLPSSSKRLARMGIYLSASHLAPSPIFLVKRSNNFFYPLIDKLRQKLKQEIERSGAKRTGLLLAMLLGERSEIPRQISKVFQNSGAGHILVISGLHLSLIGAFSFFILLGIFRLQPWILKRFNPYPLAGILSIFPISFYALLSGMRLPTFRAYIMILLLFLALVLYRTRYLLNALGLAGLIILILNPTAVFNASFQLSFLAVGVLIIYFPGLWRIAGGKKLQELAELVKLELGKFVPYLKWLGVKFGQYLYSLFLATVLIQLFILPISAYYFMQINIFAPLVNMILVPICGFWLLPLGFAGICFSLFSHSISCLLFELAGWGAGIMLKIAEFFARLSFAKILIPPPEKEEFLGYYLAIISAFWIINFWGKAQRENFELKKLISGIAGVVFGVGLMLFSYFSCSKFYLKENQLRINLFDVGSGQSLLIELPENKAVLIDGGGRMGEFDIGESIIARALLKRKIKTLTAIILTHPELDHAFGLKYIIENFKVKEILLTKKINSLALDLINLATYKNIKIKWVDASTPPIRFGDSEFSFLSPKQGDLKQLSLNDSSLVIKFTHKKFNLLIAGDISAKIEKELVKNKSHLLSSQVLIAPHHGSATSSSEEFLKAVSPKLILISCSKDFPSKQALQRMRKYCPQILRTDQDGEIDLIIDNEQIHYQTFSAKSGIIPLTP